MANATKKASKRANRFPFILLPSRYAVGIDSVPKSTAGILPAKAVYPKRLKAPAIRLMSKIDRLNWCMSVGIVCVVGSKRACAARASIASSSHTLDASRL